MKISPAFGRVYPITSKEATLSYSSGRSKGALVEASNRRLLTLADEPEAEELIDSPMAGR